MHCERLVEAKKLAAEIGLKIDVPAYIDDEHTHSLWFNGILGSVTKGKYTIYIRATGIVRAYLFHEGKEYGNCIASFINRTDESSRFMDVLGGYIKCDDALETLMRYGTKHKSYEDGQLRTLEVVEANYFDWILYDREREEYIDGDNFDTSFEDSYLLECLSTGSLYGVFEQIKTYDAAKSQEGKRKPILRIQGDGKHPLMAALLNLPDLDSELVERYIEIVPACNENISVCELTE